MKKMFKKIVASVMAVSTLSVGTIGMNVNAYGGTDTFTVNGALVTKSIDAYKSSASAYTECYKQSCSRLLTSLTCSHASTGFKNDFDSITRGKAVARLTPDDGKIFKEASSIHQATINGVKVEKEMTVRV